MLPVLIPAILAPTYSLTGFIANRLLRFAVDPTNSCCVVGLAIRAHVRYYVDHVAEADHGKSRTCLTLDAPRDASPSTSSSLHDGVNALTHNAERVDW